MNHFIRKKNVRLLAVLLSLIITFLCPTYVCALAKKTTISASTLQNGKQFTFVDMPYNGKYSPVKSFQDQTLRLHGIQNFAFTPDGKYVFTTSQADSGGERHTLLSRCTVPSKKGENATAPFQQALLLPFYGHGEGIAITQPNRKKQTYYIWVACSANGRFGTDIARLTYTVKRNEGELKKTVVINTFSKADIENGRARAFEGNPQPQRLNVAVDTKSSQIMFRIKFSNGCNYISYDYKKLNTALNKLPNGGTYSIANAVKYQKANIRTNLVPCGSFQSFDTDGKNLYICGGGLNIGAQIYVIPYKSYNNGKVVKQSISHGYKVINITPKLVINGKTLGKTELEIEGMKVTRASGGKMNYYVSFYRKRQSARNTTAVYKFTL